MTNEMVRCGCGGDPVCQLIPRGYNTWWVGEVHCPLCGINIQSDGMYTSQDVAAQEAIEAWNTALRGRNDDED